VQAGDTLAIRVTGSYENWQQIKVFIDFDNNGLFDMPDEEVSSGSGGILVDTIIMPLQNLVLCHPLRMRIVTELPGAPEPTPCLLTGTPEEGVGQIEDYAILIKPRAVASLTSGNWDQPANWSCQCVPAGSDFVTIHSGHHISVTPAMGMIACAGTALMPGAILDVSGCLYVTGGCQ
jgi:hypothetical protein